MDYTKNFKAKNIVIRIISFIIYFFTAGFMGKLCAILMEPALLIILRISGVKNYEEVKNTILYIVSAIIMIAALSFFSKREGYNDMEFLRFSLGKTVISYISAGIIFCLLVIIIVTVGSDNKALATVKEYFLAPYFFPDDLNKFINNIVFFPNNTILYTIFEKIKYFILLKWTLLFLTIIFNILFTVISYKAGGERWIERKNARIRQLKQEQKSKKSRIR